MANAISKIRQGSAAILLAALTVSAHAQEATKESATTNTRSGWQIYVESMSVDEDIALEQGIGDSAVGLGLEYIQHRGAYFHWAAGASIISIDDNDYFYQAVEELYGNDYNIEKSAITALSFQAEVGARYPINQSGTILLGMDIGWQYFHLERTIELCSNCNEESIELDNPIYFQPHIDFKIGNSKELSVAYTAYQGDGFDGALRVSFGFGF